MKRKCLAENDCPMARAYDAIGDWWSLLIVMRVLVGKRRFSEIQEDLGMARNILTTRLKKLVDHGILERVPASDGSAYQEYSATDKGKDLFTILVALRQWGEKHFKCGEEKYRVIDRKTGDTIPVLEVRASDGRVMGPEDMETVCNQVAQVE